MPLNLARQQYGGSGESRREIFKLARRTVLRNARESSTQS